MRVASAVAIALATLSGCRDGGGGSAPPPAAEAGAPAPATSQAAGPSRGPRTTSPAIALQNLDAQIRGAEELAAREGAGVARQATLVSLLLDRGTFLGRFADLERALDVAEGAVKGAPAQPKALALRAKARAALHHFREALDDLAKAEALGEPPGALEGARAAILEALGRYDEALPLRRKAREAWANVSSLGTEAALAGEMGQTAEAERLFGEALKAYREVSPFPAAWLSFQHGMMWERAGELDRARQLYEDAHARLPLYAHAAAHLAALSPPSRAVEILGPIVESSDDPQYAAQLAEATRLAGAGDGAALLERARARFEELEKLHPEAVADHAGWFWLGPGKDPARALALAQKNADARPTAAAYELLVEAATRGGKTDAACGAAERALGLRYPTPKLRDGAARALDVCGKPDQAAAARGRAAEGSKEP